MTEYLSVQRWVWKVKGSKKIKLCRLCDKWLLDITWNSVGPEGPGLLGLALPATKLGFYHMMTRSRNDKHLSYFVYWMAKLEVT